MNRLRALLKAAGYTVAAEELRASDVNARAALEAWELHASTGLFVGLGVPPFKAAARLKVRGATQ